MDHDKKILLFDLETTHLKADLGFCLCIGYKWLGEDKVHVPSIKEHPGKHLDDALMRHFFPIISEADIMITYNGIRFDQRFLNTRMYKAGLKPLPPIPHIDLLYTMKSKFNLHSNRLANVQEFLELKDEKTPIKMDVWVGAMMGSAKDLRYIVEHCEKDVLVLEQAYEKVKPWMLRHPRVNGYGPCPVCGSTKMQKRGYALVKPPNKNVKQRFQCQSCGSWSTQTLTK